MLVSFFARGTGAGRGPVEYCVLPIVPAFDPVTRIRIPGEFVHRDPVPVVMAGDMERTIRLIDSNSNKNKYTSGVVAWAPEDNPSLEQQRLVMDSFEKYAFAGLDRDQYDILWVRHLHEGNVELHFVIPKKELSTGKALNVAPPGHEKYFDEWRYMWNYSVGWASPDEPARQKLAQQDRHVLKMDAALLKAGLKKSDDPKRLISEFLVQRLEAGLLKNRADVIAALIDAGFLINRENKSFVSIRLEPGADPIRLKGPLYDVNFTASFNRGAALRSELGLDGQLGGAAESENGPGSFRNPADDARRAVAATEQLERAFQRRRDFNAKRYGSPGGPGPAAAEQPGQPDPDRDGQHYNGDRGSSPGPSGHPDGGGELADEGIGNGGHEDRHADRPAGDKAGQNERNHKNHAGQNGWNDQKPAVTNSPGASEANQNPVVAAEAAPADFGGYGGAALPQRVAADLGLPAHPIVPSEDSSEAIYGRQLPSHNQPGLEGLQDGERPIRSVQKSRLASAFDAIQTTLKGLYDRARTAIGESIAGAWAAVCGGHESLERASEQLERAIESGAGIAEASQQLDRGTQGGPSITQGSRELDAAAGRVQQRVKAMSIHRDQEIARFKSEINLVEYAEANGYVKDKKESSVSSATMRRGDEKIVVATDKDGHGIYFNVRDSDDHGSIIDFVQHRDQLNLGQVRRQLRPWIGEGKDKTVHRKPLDERPPKPQPTSVDLQNVLLLYQQMRPAAGKHPYLETARMLSESTLSDPRFIDRLRIDARGNAVFPHYNAGGLSGYELKNAGFTGFSSGGMKGLWTSSNVGRAKNIVIVESAIDALSHAQLFNDLDTAYVSIGGNPSNEQTELIGRFLAKAHARGASVIIGTDPDEGGDKLADTLRALAPPGMVLTRDEAQIRGEDWNDQLIKKVKKLDPHNTALPK